MAGYRCRVQGTRPSVSSIPSSSFDRWGSAERGGILREGIETRARRAKLFRGKLIRSRERAWNYRRWGRRKGEGRREEGGTRSLIDVCRKSDRYFGTIRLFFLGSFVQGHLVANHLESVVYALLLFFSFFPFRSSSCLLVSSSSSFSFSFPFLPFFSAV